MSEATFVDDLLAGEAVINDFDDYVDRWHDLAEGNDSAPPLAAFLGVSEDEYDVVFRNPASFRFVTAARVHHLDLAELMASQADFALAARTGDLETAKELVGMLRDAGKLPLDS